MLKCQLSSDRIVYSKAGRREEKSGRQNLKPWQVCEMWYMLTVLAVLCLLITWKSKNAVWGGIPVFGMIGLIASLIRYFRGHHFDWHFVGRCIVVGVLLGSVLELLARISQRHRAPNRE